jgi:hypothetical protein
MPHPTPQPHSLTGLIRQVGMGRRWVVSRLGNFRPNETGDYSPACLQHLMEEKKAFKQIPALSQNYTLPAAGRRLHCSHQYAEVLAKKHGLPGVQSFRTPTNRVVRGLPRATVHELRRLLPPIAPEGWANQTDLKLETGWSKDTIATRLEVAGLEGVDYRRPTNGHIAQHYPTDKAVEVLGFRPRHLPPGGNYLTAYTMGRMLKRNHDWVRRRLVQYAYVATERLDDNENIRKHYPRWVYLNLKRESDIQRLGQQTHSDRAS